MFFWNLLYFHDNYNLHIHSRIFTYIYLLIISATTENNLQM